MVLAKAIRHVTIPYYESLSIEEILKFARQFEAVQHYLPIEKDLKRWPRQYLANLLGVVLKNRFQDWVSQRVLERNATMVREKNLSIAIIPECQTAFANSTYVSSKYLKPLPLPNP